MSHPRRPKQPAQPKRAQPPQPIEQARTPWLDPTVEFTDAEEAALDAVVAQIDQQTLDAANAATHARAANAANATPSLPLDAAPQNANWLRILEERRQQQPSGDQKAP